MYTNFWTQSILIKFSVILVGTQADQRWQVRGNTVTQLRGKALADRLGAEFFECSALTQHNLKQVG